MEITKWSPTKLYLLALFFVFAGKVSLAYGGQSSTNYLVAYRYNLFGDVTGIIYPDADGSGPLGYKAIRYVYDSNRFIVEQNQGELAYWQDENVAPNDWAGFSIHSTNKMSNDSWGNVLVQESIGTLGLSHSLIQSSYDKLGKVECNAVRMNPSAYAAIPNDACLLGAEGVYGPDRITKYSYNDFGDIADIKKALGTSLEQNYVSNTYSDRNLKESTTDANGNRNEYVYDEFGRLTFWYFPSKTNAGEVDASDYEQYSYDKNGNRVALRKRDAKTITYEFDNLDRLIKKGMPKGESSVFYEYDLLGLNKSIKFDSGSGYSFLYDGFGRLRFSESDLSEIVRSAAYDYDKNGNKTKIIYPDGYSVEYVYDQLDRIGSIKENGDVILIDYAYYSDGNMKSIGRDGGASSFWAYDEAGRMESLTHDLNGQFADYSASFSYNPANQAVSKNLNNDLYRSDSFSRVLGDYSSNGLNQYSSIAGSSLSYDKNGNLISYGQVNFSYDSESRLKNIDAESNLTLDYGPMGRLFEMADENSSDAHQLFYDGDALIAEYDSFGNLLKRYIHAPGADKPLVAYSGSDTGATSRKYLFSDVIGSIVAQSNGFGEVEFANSYDAFGIASGTNEGRFGYTGQINLGVSGLQYYKARIYLPKVGRFLQTDPIGYEDQMNLYAYVANDPVNATDPTGEFLHILGAGVIGGVVGASVNAAVQYATTGKVNVGDALAAGAGAGLASAAIAANPALAANPLALSALGAVTNSGASVAGDVVNGRDVSASKAAVAFAAGAIAVPVGAKAGDIVENFAGARSTSIVGELLGAASGEGAGAAINAAVPAAADGLRNAAETISEGVRGLPRSIQEEFRPCIERNECQ